MLPRIRMPLMLVVALFASAVSARAQYLPSSPLVFGNGRVVLGGDVAASISGRDEAGWFNYTDYENDALRLFRIGISGEWRIAERWSLLGEFRSYNARQPETFAAYLRVRPFAGVPFDIQAGRIPPTFGAFGRRQYANDNPLIGYPLAYQYLLSIRPDAIPATPDDLLRMRARGWQSSFPVGSPEARPGVSVVSGFEWDLGVQARAGTERLQGAIAVTSGTLSTPRVDDDNGGKQVSGRLQIEPVFGLVLGVSAARGAWLAREIERRAIAGGNAAAQRAVGIDAEYSRGHWIIRAEAIRSIWTVPSVQVSAPTLDLTATTGWVESSYRFTPRLFVAARVDGMTFSDIRGTFFGGQPTPWEAPVGRTEVGAGWYLQRNLVAKATVQRNWRDAGRERQRTFVAAQILYWF